MGYCLNVKIFEITSVFIHANIDVAQFSEQSYLRISHCHVAKGRSHISIITPSLGNIFFDIRNVITRQFCAKTMRNGAQVLDNNLVIFPNDFLCHYSPSTRSSRRQVQPVSDCEPNSFIYDFLNL